MNPCTWLAGGGANAGGGSGKDGTGGDGTGGAGGDGEKKDPDDGGKNSGACGQGANGACTNCGHAVAAGDPVDVMTGTVFTVPKTDLFLPGTYALELLRSYSTQTRNVDVGLGFGWSHSLGWRLEVRRGHIKIYAGDGRVVEVPKLEIGQTVRSGPWGVLRGKDFYVVRPGNEFIHYFTASERDPDLWLLRFVRYRQRGYISLQYENDRLARVIDTVGRVALFEGNAQGHVASISVPDPRGSSLVFARYAYDNEGNLVASADADGQVTRFAYDDAHRLTRQEYPTGLTVHYKYNAAGRCVETWGDRTGAPDPSLASGLPPVLADGVTRTRGIYHCRFDRDDDGSFVEVVDSVRARRFFAGPGHTISKAVSGRGGVTTRTYDDRGRVATQTDQNGSTWSYEYDELDELVREVNPEGYTISIDRDGGGREVRLVDPAGGVIVISRNDDGEAEYIQLQSGALRQNSLDAYGLVEEVQDERGGRHRYERDLHANVIAYTGPTGARYVMTYDYWGRALSERDPLGGETVFTQSASGRVLSTRDALGRVVRYDYDGLGKLTRYTAQDGTTESYEYGGLGWLCSIRRADGSEVKVEHNREGWPVAIVNELGARFEFEYDEDGLVIRQRDFHGRVTRFGYDPRGWESWYDEGAGKVEITRNRLGQVVERLEPEGGSIQYEYDPRGQLLEARSPGVSVAWLRDALGLVVREEISIGSQQYVVDTKRGLEGDRAASRTSLGLELALDRDVSGSVTQIRGDSGPVLGLTRNAQGQVVRRELPGGAAIRDHFDAVGRLTSRQVDAPGASGQEPGTPEWVGWSPGTLGAVYDYSPVDEVIMIADANAAPLELAYDVRRHLVERKQSKNIRRFSADAADNYFELTPGAPGRRYEAGNQLSVSGATQFSYDTRGFLQEKRTPRAEGPDLLTRFEWNGWGLLQAVESSDGERVEFQYDPFARRVAKRTLRDGKVIDAHHYVWDLVSMVHDVQLGDRAQHAAVQTYLYPDNDDETPIAQRDAAGGWVYYVGGVTDAPEKLIDRAGKLLGQLDYEVFGRVTSAASAGMTPFRAPGQQEDRETGLHYNRYRYYDPDIGRYISPDPIDLAGGLNLYSAGPNPVAWIDPMGWSHFLDVFSNVQDMSNGVRLVSGGMSGNAAVVNPCPPELCSMAKCHTEQKRALDLLGKTDVKGQHAGKKETWHGRFPPCPNCHAAMMRAAEHSGADIEYKWKNANGDVQSIKYQGGTGAPTPSGANGSQEAHNIVKAYGGAETLDKNWKPSDMNASNNPGQFWGFNQQGTAQAECDKQMGKSGTPPEYYKPGQGNRYWKPGEQAL